MCTRAHCVAFAFVMLGLVTPAWSEEAAPQWRWNATLAATSDYVYRGVSLREERPSPILFLESGYGPLYANVFVVGTELGEDALGRGIGEIETDITVGIAPTIGNVDLNLGVRMTKYLTGRDIIAGTLDHAERDFYEPFAGATVKLDSSASVTGTVYWTPDYYGESGSVLTVEGQANYILPAYGKFLSKLGATVGHATSDNPNIVAPGHSYLYYNVGLEARVEQILFDLRYWNTDVEGFDAFDQRFVLSMGISLN